MKIINKNIISETEYNLLLKRPAIDSSKTFEIVKPVLDDIKSNGMSAVLKYVEKFDGLKNVNIRLTDDEFNTGAETLDDETKQAIDQAYENIWKFHELQKQEGYTIETMPGIKCSRQYRAIENVGIYIPGGTAVLPSTMLMLAIPALIAGCGRIVACSPSKDGKVNPALLYAAKKCGVKEFYKIGGAQAVGLMAYGMAEIKKVDKIFGPGNQFVTAAKAIVSIDPDGCAIDMPAGPSEVLVIADKTAVPKYIASDLLSQAEHGKDSQAVLVTDSKEIAEETAAEVKRQIEQLGRKEYAQPAIDNSFVLVVNNIGEAIEFSNNYAPEHLILSIENYSDKITEIKNAGSVFLGNYSPESVGDYASGTNHSLPTYAYAKSFSGVSVDAFMKAITFQELSPEGLKNISKTVIKLAETEALQAHANAVKIRIENGN